MKFKSFYSGLLVLFFSCNLFGQEGNYDSNSIDRMDPGKSIITNTSGSKTHQTLLAVMKAADLEDVLSFDGPFTVFAPSDLAFEKLSENTIKELMLPINKRKIQALMRYHIIAGNFSASRILKAMCRGGGKASFTTVQGDVLLATMDGVDIVLADNFGNSAKIVTADANQSNGVMHEIDSVILHGKL